ncbi:MAG: type II toxin-antitoxin system RelE/ParE family toxin [Acidobacteria bacterium]|nr:type II toxin-antitoxin system RelE/ParE family toxin [Acidobacteriota bacterium]
MKAAVFHPAARAAIRLFPAEVRKELGKAIFDLQNAEILGMPLSRPLPSLERGAAELRLRDRSGIYRALYYTRSLKGVLIFHAFVKKSRAIPKHEMDLAKKRLKELMDEET